MKTILSLSNPADIETECLVAIVLAGIFLTIQIMRLRKNNHVVMAVSFPFR